MPPSRSRSGFSDGVDYLAIAKREIVVAREIKRYPKLLFYARKKQGKTTLALTAGTRAEVLVVDPEKGSEYKQQYNPYIWKVENWQKMQDVYGALRTGKLSPYVLGKGPEKEPFKWVVIDGLTRINNFALHFVRQEQEERDLSRRPGFVDRRDYNKSGELMKQMLTNFHGLEMGVIYTAQERMKTLDLGDDEDDVDEEDMDVVFVPELPDAVRNAANSWADVIGRIYTARVEINGKQEVRRRLRIGVHDRYDTGVRSDFVLPDIVKNPTVPKLIKLMETGRIK